MRIAFFGTPSVAVPALDLLAERHEVAVVVTRAPRPRGRSGAPVPSAVQEHAVSLQIPVLTPATPREEGFATSLASYRIEATAVVAYGYILPPPVLQVAPAMNAHFSLLPAYRGAAPVQRALMDGVATTGVSVFLLEPTLDTGPVVAMEEVAVGEEETAGELMARLAPIGARLLASSLDALAGGEAHPVPQDDSRASSAPKITPEDARIDWARPAREIANQVRALNPSPGAFTIFRGKRLIVWRAGAVPTSGAPGAEHPAGTGAPGTFLDPTTVCARDGALRLIEVQPEGKRAMAVEDWSRGARPTLGEPLS